MFGNIGKFFRKDEKDKDKAREQGAPLPDSEPPHGSEAAAPYEPDRGAEADFVPDPTPVAPGAEAVEPLPGQPRAPSEFSRADTPPHAPSESAPAHAPQSPPQYTSAAAPQEAPVPPVATVPLHTPPPPPPPAEEPVALSPPPPAAPPVAPAAAPPEPPVPAAVGEQGFFGRLKAGLSKTRDNLAEGLSSLFLGRKEIDEDLLDDIETQLLSADLGLEATTEVLDELRRRVKRHQVADPAALYEALKQILFDLLQPASRPLLLPPPGGKPFVILMVGVNGVGKTTTIGKLARRYQGEGRQVLLAAGDTFRAAAVEQLQAWGDHNAVPVIAQHTGADSASVIFDAYQAARARGIDVLIADTAGRLHTKGNLMQELEKVLRVLRKLDADLPQEVLLVLDATTGQNALSQAKHFTEAVQVSGLVISKLDGSAKGGMVFAIAKQLGLPIRYIGFGERADDLRPFDARQFVDALFATR